MIARLQGAKLPWKPAIAIPLLRVHSFFLLPLLPSPSLQRNMESQLFNPDDIKAQLAKTKYDQKWEVLKPVVRKLWMEEDRKLSELMMDIQTSYGFTAQSAFHASHFRFANLLI